MNGGRGYRRVFDNLAKEGNMRWLVRAYFHGGSRAEVEVEAASREEAKNKAKPELEGSGLGKIGEWRIKPIVGGE